MIKKVKKVTVYYLNQPMGVLALTPEGLCAFEYAPQFLTTGIQVSPFYLPLKSGVFIAKKEPFNGLFGVFNDSLPDGWGTLLTDRMLAKHKIPLAVVNVLNRLCIIGGSGMGALTFEPEWENLNQKTIADIQTLANEAAFLLKTNTGEHLDQLFQYGGSSGGARPKIFYTHNNEEWIVKFNASIDPENMGYIEYEYALAAKKCGIEMPEVNLFNNKYFGVKRFDRNGLERFHVHSASGLLYASFRYPSLDYTELIKATIALTRDITEAYKIFRIMVFNVLNKNRDDHAKNFSFILKDKTWKVSPAYDLVYSKGFGEQHTTTISGSGTPTKKEIFELAVSTGLDAKKSNLIFDEVYENSRELSRLFKFF
jgi:serine/threonine-protein kinase HipA